MLSDRQTEIIKLLNKNSQLKTAGLLKYLKITRARLNQLIVPLIKKGLVKRYGFARATTYKISDTRTKSQISRENWVLRKKIRELEMVLEDRKVIERAKEILIAQFDILPTEAYRKMQDQSMDSGKPMRNIAERILAAYELT
ncbi:MAG: ANTAR domain-containing protein [Candidatus Saganbacteria bacterium]|nr:ANTAR domain-containing protein [Candidatus Saganbacteria bacterium]